VWKFMFPVLWIGVFTFGQPARFLDRQDWLVKA
jgi:hypothetical protein